MVEINLSYVPVVVEPLAVLTGLRVWKTSASVEVSSAPWLASPRVSSPELHGVDIGGVVPALIGIVADVVQHFDDVISCVRHLLQ